MEEQSDSNLTKLPMLVGNNYPTWSTKCLNYFKLKGLSDHFNHVDFPTYFNAVFPPTSKEKRLILELVAFRKEKPGTRQAVDIEKDIVRTEDFLDSREQLEAKEKRLWILNESKIQAVLIACTAARYHTAILACTSTPEIWKRLRVDSNQDETPTFMLYMSTFFRDAFGSNDNLVNFAFRIRRTGELIVQCLGRDPTWEEVLCLKILSCLPQDYDTVQAACFSLAKVTLEEIGKKFQHEDSRRSSNKLILADSKPKKEKATEEAHQAQEQKKDFKKPFKKETKTTQTPKKEQKIRNCSVCKAKMGTDQPPNYYRCNSCQTAFVQAQKAKDTGQANMIFHAMTMSDREAENARIFYMDSG